MACSSRSPILRLFIVSFLYLEGNLTSRPERVCLVDSPLRSPPKPSLCQGTSLFLSGVSSSRKVFFAGIELRRTRCSAGLGATGGPTSVRM